MALVRIILVCCIGFLITNAAALLIGQQQPNDSLLLDLARCQNRVCAHGIAPAVTTYAAATAFLTDDPDFELSTMSIAGGRKRTAPYYQLVLYIGGNDVPITEIDILFDRLRVLTAAQIVAKFGLPCAVIPRYVPDRIVLLYPGMVVYLETDPASPIHRLAFPTRIAQINLLDNGLRDCHQMKFSSVTLPWRGFRAY